MQASISFNLRATGPGLTVVVTIDDLEIYRGEPGPEPTLVHGGFDDDIERDRALTITLSGKLPEHTEISESGEILVDRVIEISDLCFDNISLGYVMTETATYTHDRNGTAPEQQDKFYGVMGCNGEVRLPFRSPMYLWLLEHL